MNPRHRRSPKNLTLNLTLPDWDSGDGIFSKLEASTTPTPWHSYVSAVGLDIAYHGMNSGNKFVTDIFYKYLDDDGELTAAGAGKIVSAIQARFYQKWTHLWSDYVMEYSPLNTYDITESGSKTAETETSDDVTRTPNLTERRQGDDDITYANDATNELTHGHVITDSGTDTTTDTHGHVITESGSPVTVEVGQVKGFDSSDFVDKTKDTTTQTLGKVETHSGQDTSATQYGKIETNSGKDTTSIEEDSTTQRDIDISTTTTGTERTVSDGTDSYSEEFSSTKQGTMYRAPAELLKLDRDFWLDDYFSIIFADLDSLLTLSVYSESEPSRYVF